MVVVRKWCVPGSTESGFRGSHATVMMRSRSYSMGCSPAELAVPALSVVPDLEVGELRVGELDRGVPGPGVLWCTATAPTAEPGPPATSASRTSDWSL